MLFFQEHKVARSFSFSKASSSVCDRETESQSGIGPLEKGGGRHAKAVSYTHLTLPTTAEV